LSAASDLVTAARGDDALLETGRFRQVLALLDAWSAERAATALAGADAAAITRRRRRFIARLRATIQRLPVSRRASANAWLSEAWATLALPLGEGEERALEELMRSSLADESWLHSARQRLQHRRVPRRPAVAPIALLLLEP